MLEHRYSGGVSGRSVHMIPIYSSSRVVASSTHSSSFVVITLGKKYKIEAKTAAEQSEWVNSLRHIVDMLDLTSVKVKFEFDDSNDKSMSSYSSNAITLGGLRGSIRNVCFENGDVHVVHRGDWYIFDCVFECGDAQRELVAKHRSNVSIRT